MILLLSLPLFCGCEEIILEDDISGAKVKLMAPGADAVFSSTSITFTWEPIENGTQYQIQIARPNFTNPLQIVADNTMDVTSFTTQLNVGEYEWRVRAVNSGYASLYTTRAFEVINNDDFQNNSVALSLPADNLITNIATHNLVWQSVLGANNYHVQIVNITSSSIISEQDVSATNFSYTFPEGNFIWKIRASNGTEHTLYSQRSILVDLTAPATPTLSSPGNLSNSSNNEVSFQWSRNPIAGSVETDSIFIYKNQQLTDLEFKGVQTTPYVTTLENGTYHWYVQSFDQAGNVGTKSTVYSFTLN